MSKSPDSLLSRRSVFAGAGTAGALAAAATVLPLSPQAPAQAEASPQAPPEEDGRYQVTQHVLRYYQTAKV